MKLIRMIVLVSLMFGSLPVINAQARPAEAPLLAASATPVPAPVLLAPVAGSTPDVIRPVFDWADVPGATAYEIQVSIYSSFTITVIDLTPAVSTFTPSDDLPRYAPPNNVFYWRVRVISPAAGAYSPVSTFVEPNPPSSPNPVDPVQGKVVVSLTPTFSWTPSTTPLPAGTTFAYYQLQVDDNADFASPSVDAQVGATSYTLAQALAPNSTYNWRIRTANTLNQFSGWRSSTFVTSLAPPTLLSPALGETAGSLRPRFDWSDVTGATGYGLEVSARSDFSSDLINVVPTASEYTPTLDLTANATIYWRVRTHGTNISDWANSTFTTPGQGLITGTPSPTATPTITPTASSTPVGPTATPTGTPTASSTPVGPTATPTGTPTATQTLTGPSATPTPTPSASTTATVTRTPTITLTPTISLTPTPTRTALPRPVLLAPPSGSTPNVIRPTFDWTDMAGATSYEIQVSTYSNFAILLIDLTPTKSLFTPTIDLTRNVTTYWRVRVISPAAGPWSAPSSFKAPNPPYSPAPVSPGLNALVTALLPTLDWNPSVLPTGTSFACYQLQVADASTFASPLIDIKITDSARSAYTFTTALNANATYYWRIRTVNTLNQFSLWRTSNFRTTLQAPGLIAPLALSTPEDLRPMFDWSDVIAATGYGLQVSVRPDFSSTVISVAVTASSYQPAADLPPGTLLYWRVRTQGGTISAWRNSSFTSPNPPNMLTLVSPASQALVSLNPTLSWSAAILPAGTSFAYYQLRLSINNNPDTPVFNTTLTGLAQHSYTFIDTSVVNPSNGQYYWHVRAANTAGQFSTWASRGFLLSNTTATPTRTVTPTRTLTPTITLTPTRTLTPTPSGLDKLYQNNIWGFKFNYPNDASIDNQDNNSVQMHFTIMPATNLGQKYLQAGAWNISADSPCQTSQATRPGSTGVTELINGISFLREQGQDAGVGNVYDWVSYSAANAGVCVNMLFILHSINPDMYYPNPAPLFDKLGESQVFSQIMNTFAWSAITMTTTPTITPTP